MGIKLDFIFDPSLVLHLPLYELDGSSFMAKDACGHLCTAIGALWRAGGRYFDGSDDYINTEASVAFDIDNKDFTFELWVNVPTSADIGWAGIIIGSSYTSGYDLAAGRLLCGTGLPLYIDFQATVPRDRWYHLLATHDAAAKKGSIYIDSAFIASSNYVGSLPTSDQIVRIGRESSHYLNALIGEVRIYNRVLTSLEIQHNYLATKWRYQ